MADPQPFNVIAAGWPQDLPAEAYDQARRKYFDTVVAPRLDRGSNPIAAWDHFKQNTERKSTLSTSGKALLPVAQFATGVTHALTKPLSTVLPKDKNLARVSEVSEAAEKSLTRTASREGRSNLPTAAGEMLGSVAPIAAAAYTGGASLEVAGVEVGSMAHRLLTGGLAFGAFEAASAEEGERLTAGVKGFGVGLAFEGALGLGGKLLKRGIPQKEIDSIVTKVLSGEETVSPEIDNEITQQVKQDAQVSRKEGRPQFIKEDPNYKGVGVLLHDKDGNAVTIKVKSPNEHAAVKQVLDITNAGGVVDGIIHHPNEVGTANRFMRASTEANAQKYEGAKVIRTEEGHAPHIALEEQLDGKPTIAVSDSELVTQTPQRAAPTGPEIARGVKQLRDEDGYELSLGAQGQIAKNVRRLWRNDVPDANKQVAAEALKNWDLKDLIPEQWQLDKPLPDDILKQNAEQDFVSEVDQIRQQEIAEREPSRVGAERFEEIGTTHAEPQGVNNILIPPSEDFYMLQTGDGPVKVPYDAGAKVGVTPRRFGIVTSRAALQQLMPGTAAIAYPPEYLDKILDELGVPKVQESLRGLGLMGEEKPAMIFEEGEVRRSYVYHEGLHVDKYHIPNGVKLSNFGDIGEDPIKSLRSPIMQTANDIADGLRGNLAYKRTSQIDMREEAFVHSATAIRMGDAKRLAELVKMDKSVEDVFNMVHDRASVLRNAASEAVDSYPVRVLARKMDDLMLRTGSERSFDLMDQTSRWLGDSWYDPAGKVWRSITPENEQVFDGLHALANDIDKRAQGELWAPSSTLFAEARGVRGPIVPRGGSPVQKPISMDTPPDTRWSAWTAASGWFRPMGPWVNDLHTRVNDALSSSGKNLPIYPRWKEVDEAFRNGDTWLQTHYDSAAKLLEGLGKKQYDYFNVLVTDPNAWPEMAKQLKLDQTDLTKIQKIDEWLGEFRDDTGILVKNYLRDEFPRLRGFNYQLEHVYGRLQKTPDQMSTFERLITEGKLDPKSTHIGSFINTMLREGFSKKFTDRPLKELEKLVDLKAKDGSYLLGNMRHPLVNYTRYMRGIPDAGAQMMNKGVTEFFNFLGERGKTMNKYLPSYAQLPEKFEYPRSYINKMLVWSYAAGLGLRASIPIRDALQVFSTGLPILGPKKFLRGLTEGLSKEGWELSTNSGALLTRHNIGDLYGDIFNELPPGASTDQITKLANKLLAPSRWGHNLARNVMFSGEYHSALEGVRDLRAGQITPEEFVRERTSLWWNDKPVIERIMGQVHDSGFSDEDIAKNVGLETLDLTMWPYRRGAQPAVLRTGMGRIFGQFGMWPLNYLDFLKRGALKFGEHPKQALTATALWSASNYAAVSAMNWLGADTGKWYWFSPAAVEMSPHAKFIQDLALAPRDSPDGREARRRVLEYPLDFFPTSIEMENVYKVWDSGESIDSPGALIKILGFKPLDEAKQQKLEEMTFEERAKYEAGYGQRRRTGQ